MSIQIITDSSAYFTKEEIDQYGIKVIPLHIQFGGDDELEGFPGEFDAFFKKLSDSKTFPVTSQPSPSAFEDMFTEAIDEGKEVIAIMLSSKLSGTYNSATLASTFVDESKISVIDSLMSISGLKHLVYEAQKLADAGKSREDIVQVIERLKTEMCITFTVDTLDNLRKGGRLTGAQAMIGSLLNVKPIIELDDGKLEPKSKVRGRRQAMNALVNAVPDNVTQIYISHILNESGATQLRDILAEKYPDIDIEISIIGASIGSHLGIGALAVCYVW